MQPDISPLAKRLAEENNVEWQSLYGSGSDGRIVERDILEYLARVMAGEEDLNPTPEPLHAGMDAWPEEVAVGGGSNVQRSAQPGSSPQAATDAFTADDASLLDMDTPGTPQVSINQVAKTTDAELEDAISEDIFLFDDDSDEEVASYEIGEYDAGDEAVADKTPTSESFAVELDEAQTDSDTFSDTFDLVDLAAETAEATEQTAEPNASNNWEDGFADLNGDDADEDALEVLELTAAAAPQLPGSRDVALFDENSASGDSAEADVSLFLAEASSDNGSDDNLETDAADMPQSSTETASQAFVADGEPDLEPSLGVPIVSAPVTDAMTDAMTDVAHSSAAAPLQLVSYGLLLRRHVDLSDLRQAQVALGQELGADPIGPSSLLLRAAAKALATVPLNDHKDVGLAVFGETVQVAAVPGVLTRPFKEIAAAAAQPDTRAGQNSAFGVIVADLSELDIDEAVLRAGAPVLTLGRVLQNGSEGTHHSTLSLSGKMTVEQGTKFLAAVAGLLASPIRLVV